MKIQEVAKRANVSVATVSRTLNNDPRVNPATAQRVWLAVQELKYVPNFQARSLVSGKSRLIGLIVSDITNPFFPELVKGFEDIAVEHGYDMIVASTGYNETRMAGCVRRMIERKVDGVAIMTSELEPELTEQLERRSLPIVFLDLGQPGPSVTNIRVNYQAGVRGAVQHLLDLGHKRIAFISGPEPLKSAQVRRCAFLQHFGDGGTVENPRYIEQGDHKVEGGLEAMSRLLQLTPRPTAVLASNDLTAIGALRSIHRAGLRVPEDISIIGFDDILLAQFTDPPLTTVRLSRTEIARCSFHSLLASIEGKRGGGEIVIDTSLVIRESTASVHSGL
jgi:DNA-binding LacI/PurR family transcriptional regulator